jgi:hypothetical protein
MTNFKQLSPWWVTGITDSEGNFNINYNKKSNKVTFSYKVTQKKHSLTILVYLVSFFNVGNINIDNIKTDGYKYTISNTDDLVNVIIPHFDKYPLMGSKQLDFLDWKKAIFLYLETKDIKAVLSVKEKMNTKRSFEDRWNYLNKKSINLTPEWIQAFIDGEGSFQCGIGYHKNRDKNILKITNTLEIAQNSHDIKLLEYIKLYFDQGYLKPKYDITSLESSIKVRSVSRYVTYSSDKLINFIEQYPMYTNKHLDYLDWKKLIDLKSKGTHLTKEGVLDMMEIKKGMNKSRLYNSNLLNITDKLKIISWLDASKKK